MLFMTDLKELIGLLTEYCKEHNETEGSLVTGCIGCPFYSDDECPVSYVICELEEELENER